MMKYSVLVRAFNREDTIGQALDSVLSRRRSDVEIVVVDDASTDRTVRILESYGDGIRLLRNSTNMGQGLTWGRAIAAATGDYLVNLDADDWLLPGYFTTVDAVLDESVGVVIPSAYDYVAGSDVGVPRLATSSDARISAAAFRRRLLSRIFFRSPGVLVRRSLALRVGSPHATLWQDDWEYLLRVTRGANAVLLSTPLAVYRIHQASVSSQSRARSDRLRRSLDTFAALTRDPTSEAYLVGAERRRFVRGLAELHLRIVGSGMSLRNFPEALDQILYACGVAASEDMLSVPWVATLPLRAIAERALLRRRQKRQTRPISDLLPSAFS